LTLEFTEDYPNKAPVVRFTSKMFHPNGEYFRNSKTNTKKKKKIKKQLTNTKIQNKNKNKKIKCKTQNAKCKIM